MKPPYQITDKILQLIVTISEKIGAIHATHLYKPPTELRKRNRIKTIQSSLEIERNSLSEDQITALLENKYVPCYWLTTKIRRIGNPMPIFLANLIFIGQQ